MRLVTALRLVGPSCRLAHPMLSGAGKARSWIPLRTDLRALSFSGRTFLANSTLPLVVLSMSAYLLEQGIDILTERTNPRRFPS